MGDSQLLDESAKVRAIAAPAKTTPRVSTHDLGWVRHDGPSEWWHSIAEVACGSVMTLCGGCMSVSAPFDLEARPAWPDRCARCQTLYAQRAMVMAGLDELVIATMGVAEEGNTK